MYPEGAVPLRLLRLRHSHIRQNITYNCDSGADGFMQAELLGINGGIFRYGDKTLRMVSVVRNAPLYLYHRSFSALLRVTYF